MKQNPDNHYTQLVFFSFACLIQLLIELAKEILERHLEITPTRVIGHADIQPAVKSDPGPKFPWQILHQHGIGAWYEHETVNKYWLKFTEDSVGYYKENKH